MAVYRDLPRCKKCGRPTARAVHKKHDGNFVGDTFLYWEGIEHDCQERFKKPTDEELIKVAILFNDGCMDAEALGNMVSMCQFIINRLYENGNCLMPTAQEILDNGIQSLIEDKL